MKKTSTLIGALIFIFSLTALAKTSAICNSIFVTEGQTIAEITRDLQLQVYFETETVLLKAGSVSYDEYHYLPKYKLVRRVRYTTHDHRPEPTSEFIASWEKASHVKQIFTLLNIMYELNSKILSPQSHINYPGEDDVHDLAQNFTFLTLFRLKEKGILIRNLERNYQLFDNPRMKTPSTDRSLIVFTILNTEYVVNRLITQKNRRAIDQFFTTLNFEIDMFNHRGPQITPENFPKLIQNLVTHILKADITSNETHMQAALNEL